MNALELTAQRQAIWSATANSLKTTLERVRWATFALSILGALLATIAAQYADNVRLSFAMAGAAVLATGTFLTARLMDGSHVAAWARARAASEALKREAYKCATLAAPYADDAGRMARLNVERQKIEDTIIDLIDKAVTPKKAGSTPAADMAPPDYIERRVARQANGYYEPKAEEYRRLAAQLGWIEFALALAATLITAVIGVASKEAMPFHFDFVALAAVVTTISGAIVAHVEASRYKFLVTTYRATARHLNNELANITEPFVAPSAAWSDFVNRCETIIGEENGSWLAKWTS
jgi:hypothetical protein